MDDDVTLRGLTCTSHSAFIASVFLVTSIGATDLVLTVTFCRCDVKALHMTIS